MESAHHKREKENEKQVAELKDSLNDLRKAQQQLITLPEDQIKRRVRKVLQGMFTENQTKLILGEQKRVVWTSEEIAMAFSLR